jgi:hypothetical protein
MQPRQQQQRQCATESPCRCARERGATIMVTTGLRANVLLVEMIFLALERGAVACWREFRKAQVKQHERCAARRRSNAAPATMARAALHGGRGRALLIIQLCLPFRLARSSSRARATLELLRGRHILRRLASPRACKLARSAARKVLYHSVNDNGALPCTLRVNYCRTTSLPQVCVQALHVRSCGAKPSARSDGFSAARRR